MSDPYFGEIRMFGGTFAPVGWMLCQGQILPISDYEVLYALIGTTYGGNGDDNFALPNLSCRIPLHQSVDHPIGAAGGAESVVLTTPQLPAHSHTATAASGAGNSTSPSGNVWAAGSTVEYSAAQPNTTMSPPAVGLTGFNQAHENMPPFVAINFIIAIDGIFPLQDS